MLCESDHTHIMSDTELTPEWEREIDEISAQHDKEQQLIKDLMTRIVAIEQEQTRQQGEIRWLKFQLRTASSSS